MNTMRAAVIAAPGEVRVEQVPRPEPAAAEVRVRVEGCGVCRGMATPNTTLRLLMRW
jgi:D-arabinose 1-dehydrogenase-like Zn-dependent alcohol dehydrogenase